jgi:hypothetical protein
VQRSIINADFPPQHNDDILRVALHEISEYPNPKRRIRSYPHVVKRTQVGDKIIKRSHRRQALYPHPPKIKITHRAA